MLPASRTSAINLENTKDLVHCELSLFLKLVSNLTTNNCVYIAIIEARSVWVRSHLESKRALLQANGRDSLEQKSKKQLCDR